MRKLLTYLLIVLIIFSMAGCAKQEPKTNKQGSEPQEDKTIVLATTTSTKDSGLLDQLLPVFEKKTGYKVDVISQGTGQALKTGELGDCDVVLVHARAAEDKFVADGFGVNRRDVMYNDFVIVGPKNDPAGIKGLGIFEGLKKLSETKKGEFLSRGDNSGTHKKEQQLWEKTGVKPEGDWYLAVNKGMGDTLVMTSEKQGYTLTDRGTFISMKDNLKLEVLIEGDPPLLNPYGIIAINPDKHPSVNYKGAMAFIEFITSQEGKEIINGYKVKGQQLFFAK
ncbi:MAG: tungstate transport system substrate-binding protein [Clostridia bacterium]|nr:tungstate transport system substrate-binding protein [Clostridia bacterium]